MKRLGVILGLLILVACGGGGGAGSSAVPGGPGNRTDPNAAEPV